MTIEKLMARLGFQGKTIYGCEEHNGGRDNPYLTRYVLLNLGRFGTVCLHYFHRGDAEHILHDHPWHFISLILWPGYIEHTANGARRKWPGMLLIRPARWAHRVELLDSRPALTLLWRSDYVRTWGFFTREGWIPFREFFKQKGC